MSRIDGTRVAFVAALLATGLGAGAWTARAQPTWDVPPPTAPEPMFPGSRPEAAPQAPEAAAPQEADLAAIAEDAWVYGYPLVLMEVTRRQSTNVPAPMGMDAPMNQFARAEGFPDPSFKQVVRPNVDTLYASAWLDLKEPQVLHVPAMGGRYHVLPILDAWTNVFASIGSRTTGDGPADYLIVGPSWNGVAPPGMAVVRAPTETAWILGRTVANGPADLPAARAAQEGYTLTALSALDGQASPAVPGSSDPLLDTRTSPPELVAAMDGPTFFRTLARAMKTNPPAPADAPAIARFAAIGLVPGEDYPAGIAPGATVPGTPDTWSPGATTPDATPGTTPGATPGTTPATPGAMSPAPGAPMAGAPAPGPTPGTPENWSTARPAPGESAPGELVPGAPSGGVAPAPADTGSALRAAVEGAPARGLARIKRHVDELFAPTGEWVGARPNTGAYGTDYDDRAAIALAGLGANLPADAVYQQARADATGAPLDGNNRYVMHFEPGQTPPVRAFWSVTVYDEAGYLVPNALDRYAIGDRDALVRNPDGSVDIYVQHQPPAGYETNWLPAPAGPFNLTLRMYWPEEPILTGAWRAPPLQRMQEPGTY